MRWRRKLEGLGSQITCIQLYLRILRTRNATENQRGSPSEAFHLLRPEPRIQSITKAPVDKSMEYGIYFQEIYLMIHR